MEQSAEEILARLERYAASVRERSPAFNGSAPGIPRPGIPSKGESAAQWTRFLGEVSPGLLATGSCVLVILLFERLGHVFAVVTATVLMFVGAVGLLRRVPCAGALAFGVIIAGLLIRVS